MEDRSLDLPYGAHTFSAVASGCMTSLPWLDPPWQVPSVSATEAAIAARRLASKV